MSSALPRPLATPNGRSADLLHRAGILDPSHAVFFLRPPYLRPDFLTGRGLPADGRLSPGTVCGLRLDRVPPDAASLEEAVQSLRARFPSAPVVLILSLPMEESLLVTTVAARLHVRAVLLDGQPVREALRRALTQPAGIAAEVVEWLTLVGVRLSPVVVSLVHQIFALAPGYPDLGPLLRATGVAGASARFRMHKRRLPSPGRWFQAARALHVALRIQEGSDRSLGRLAHEWGYADHSALSQLVHRAFGLRPGAIRDTLGWEWLLCRWIQRAWRSGTAPQRLAAG